MTNRAYRLGLLVLTIVFFVQGLITNASEFVRWRSSLGKEGPDCAIPLRIVLNLVVKRAPPASRLVFVYLTPKDFERETLKRAFSCLSATYRQPEMMYVIVRSNEESLNRWIKYLLAANSIRRDGSFERGKIPPPTESPDELRSETGIYRAEYSRLAFVENLSFSRNPNDAQLTSEIIRRSLRYKPSGKSQPKLIFSYVSTGELRDDLVLASKLGLEDEIQEILKNGANVNASDSFGNYPLIEAMLSRHFNAVKILLDRGADINQQSFGGWSALMCALYTDNEQLAEELLRRGAAVNAKADNGDTALIIATGQGLAHSVERLLRAGASIDVKDKFGRTPELIARENHDTTTLNLLMNASKRK